MKRRHPLPSLLMVFVLLFITTGCWDMEEIEDRNQVLAMAIDQVGDDHEVTLQVPIPPNIVGGKAGPGSGSPTKHFTMRGHSLATILNKLQDHMNRRLFLGHLELVLMGEEEAKSGIQKSLDFLLRNFDVSRGLYPITVKGKAKDLLTGKNGMDPISANYILDMLRTGIDMGQMDPMSLRDLSNDLHNTKRVSPALNEFKKTKDGYQWEGISIFNRDKKVGTLEMLHANPLLHIREEKQGNPITIACLDREGTLMFAPLDVHSTITLMKQTIKITVEVEGRIREKTCDIDFSRDDVLPKIEKEVQKRYQAIAKKVIDRSQKVYKTDILELGNYLHAYRPQFYRQHNWEADYPQIPIQVNYRVYIRRHGLAT